MNYLRSKKGFTLVELMVVAVIVAILAAVAIPLMTANKKRAMATEAEAGCGMIRSCLRAVYADTGCYNTNSSGNAISGSATNVPGVGGADLSGRWFDAASYDLQSISSTGYVIRAQGNLGASAAPKKAEVDGVTITLNQDGSFTRTGL